MSASLKRKVSELPYRSEENTSNTSIISVVNSTPKCITHERPLSLQLLNKAEMALAAGAFFGMLAVICIVFLSSSILLSPLVIISTILAIVSAVTAVILLIISSAVISFKDQKIVVKPESVVLYPLTSNEINSINKEVA
ncbi:hypothetical protein ACNVED_10000 [Legionella sp. D16C41]|uniref:hypothetical protein n=1 Tax=Legionella sp. D16C41 TaxID=3402688 RepID=UPI003AF5E7F3